MSDAANTSKPLPDSFYLGDWLVESSLNRLSLGGRAVQLEPKVMDVLRKLGANAGRLTTREMLIQEVWEGAFLGEDPTTRAVSELRKVLGDSPREPRFIETIHKKGYRLIAEVRSVEEAGDGDRPEAAAGSRPSWVFPVATVFVGGLVLSLALWIARRPPDLPKRQTPAGTRRTALTSFPGRELHPAISPDGSRVAFVWSGEKASGLDLYVTQSSSGKPLQLTDTPLIEFSPAWSNDGRQIAFARFDEEGCAIYSLPALGGPERLLYRCGEELLGLDWSLGDESLVVADRRADDDGTARLWRVELASGEVTPLTDPPLPSRRDTAPQVSPDGKWIAFRRKLGEGEYEIFIIPSAGGEARQITFEKQDNGGLDWAPDGSAIVFSSNQSGVFGLWRTSLYGEVEPLGIEDAYLPSVASGSNSLVFEKRSFDLGLWRIPNPFLDGVGEPRPWSDSTQFDLDPRFSPDGRSVAFVSKRSGSFELWAADDEGNNERQLTFFAKPAPGWSAAVQNPRWSSDGKQLLFSARADDDFDVFTLRAEGGVPRPITSDLADDLMPVWAESGAWIYFVSDRSGRWEIWRVRPDDDRPEQVTSSGVDPALDSLNAGSIYYQRDSGLWSLDTVAGTSRRRLDLGSTSDWRVVPEGIYSVSAEGVSFFDFESGLSTQEPLSDTPPPAGGLAISRSGLAVSPDGRWLIYAGVDAGEIDLVLIEGLL